MINQDAVELMQYFEGLSLKPYLDAVKVPTIGYGNTHYEDGTNVKITDPAITQERASALFAGIANDFEGEVLHLLKIAPKTNELGAMVSLAYNIGSGNFNKSTLLKRFNADDIPGAANQFLVWNKAGGKVLKGLTTRRKCERLLFLGQNWKGGLK